MKVDIATDLITRAENNTDLLRELCVEYYKMYTQLSDGRQRFHFADSSYIDFHYTY